MKGNLFLGTSGWFYPDWAGSIYPENLRREGIFAHYKKYFNSVELNATFYHFPREKTVENWNALGGKNFAWSVKAWRWLTHIKRLKGVGKDLKDFFNRVSPLLTRGALLFQLPPSVSNHLKMLPKQ